MRVVVLAVLVACGGGGEGKQLAADIEGLAGVARETLQKLDEHDRTRKFDPAARLAFAKQLDKLAAAVANQKPVAAGGALEVCAKSWNSSTSALKAAIEAFDQDKAKHKADPKYAALPDHLFFWGMWGEPSGQAVRAKLCELKATVALCKTAFDDAKALPPVSLIDNNASLGCR